MNRKLTLFLVCAFEIALILFVATVAKSAAKSFPETERMKLVCQATSTVFLSSDRPMVVDSDPFEIFVGPKYINYGDDFLQREYVRNPTQVFGYGTGANPWLDRVTSDKEARAMGYNINRTLEIRQDIDSYAISYVFAKTAWPPTISRGKCNKK
jgi:hypothetical protein